MPAKNFGVKNFVVTKIGEEWLEGRITDTIEVLDEYKQSLEDHFYKIYLFSLYSEISQPIKDYFLFSATTENLKKFKVSSLRRMTQKPHIPPALRRIMEIDKRDTQKGLFVKLPARQPVSKILNDFKQYIQANKPNLFEEELEEIILGFFHIFENTFIPFLLYSKERNYVNLLLSDIKNQQKAEIFGSEYLLRAIYFIQDVLIDKVDCVETKDMVFDFSVYLLDFLDLHIEKYFTSRNY